MLSSGFASTPVSRFLFFGIITSSIAASIMDTKYFFHINVNMHLWRYKQFWRLLIWQTCYTNSTSLLFASMVFYNLRIIERLWGSRKFASFLLSTLLPTLLLPPMLLGLVLRPLSLNALNILPAGPTAILFALLAQYHTAIPTVYKYRLTTTNSTAPNANQHVEPLSLLLSDKSLVYLLGGQLALSSLPGSLLAAGVGWCVGIAWRSEIAPERWTKWRIPIGFGKKQRERGEHHGFRRRSDGERRGSAVESERENVERRRL